MPVRSRLVLIAGLALATAGCPVTTSNPPPPDTGDEDTGDEDSGQAAATTCDKAARG